MKKRFLLIMITAMMTLGSTMTVCAAPKTMPDGGTFDAEYYAKKYPDVVAALGTDENALYMHYNTFGKQEGRMPYGDLDESFFVPEDKYYLRAGWVQVGYGYTDGEYMDPALGFVRGDYTSTKLYQDLKADFLAKVNENGVGKPLSSVDSDITFVYTEEARQIVDNLAVDLRKLGIVDSCYFFNFDYQCVKIGDGCNPSRERRNGRTAYLCYYANNNSVSEWTIAEHPELIPYL